MPTSYLGSNIKIKHLLIGLMALSPFYLEAQVCGTCPGDGNTFAGAFSGESTIGVNSSFFLLENLQGF